MGRSKQAPGRLVGAGSARQRQRVPASPGSMPRVRSRTPMAMSEKAAAPGADTSPRAPRVCSRTLMAASQIFTCAGIYVECILHCTRICADQHRAAHPPHACGGCADRCRLAYVYGAEGCRPAPTSADWRTFMVQRGCRPAPTGADWHTFMVRGGADRHRPAQPLHACGGCAARCWSIYVVQRGC